MLGSDRLIVSRSGDLYRTTLTTLRNFVLAGVRAMFTMSSSGRIYCYEDNRWISLNDDNYGSNYYQFAESCGTGSEPVKEWEHIGEFVSAGTKMHTLTIVGRVDSAEVSDLDVRAVLRYPNPDDRWTTGTGGSNDSHQTIVELYSGNITQAENNGAINYMNKYSIPLGDYVATKDAQLSLYCRPVGTLSKRRYFKISWVWALSKPLIFS